MKALGYYVVVVDQVQEATKTEGGLILAETHKDDVRFKEGVVASIGEQVEGLEIGDLVLYDKHAGNGMEFKGELYKVIRSGDIAVIL